MLLDALLERPQPKWPDMSQTDKDELQGVTPYQYWQEPVLTGHDLLPDVYTETKKPVIVLQPLSTYHESNPINF